MSKAKASSLANAESVAVAAESELDAQMGAAIDAAAGVGAHLASRISESVVSIDGQYYGLINRVEPHKSKGPKGSVLGGYTAARWVEGAREFKVRGNVFVNAV